MDKTEAQLSKYREPDSREIKAEIEQTRSEMDRTVDELTEQLRPRHILDSVLDRFKSGDGGNYLRSSARTAAVSTGKWLVHEIGRHPLPAALIGAGVTWLIMEETGGSEKIGDKISDSLAKRRAAKESIARRRSLYQEPEAISGEQLMVNEPGFEKTTSPGLRNEMDVEFGCPTDLPGESTGRIEDVKGRVSDAASRAKAKMSETAGKVSDWSKEKMHRLGQKREEARGRLSESGERLRYEMRDRMERVKSRASMSRDRASEIVDEYPLIVGISAMAVGLLVGLSIPSSRRERRILGEKASHLREQVRETAEHVVERGKEAIEAAKREAERQGLTGQGIKESIKEVARSAGAAAEQEGLTAEGVANKVESVAEEATETMKKERKNKPQGF